MFYLNIIILFLPFLSIFVFIKLSECNLKKNIQSVKYHFPNACYLLAGKPQHDYIKMHMIKDKLGSIELSYIITLFYRGMGRDRLNYIITL